MDVEPGSDIARSASDERQASRWCRIIILVGLALPALAELSCDIYLSVQAVRIHSFGVAYVIPSWGPFTLNPFISNAGSFLPYALFAPVLFGMKFKSRHLARRLVLGGLVGMALTVLLMAWLLISDLHRGGQGYFLYMIVFPMILLGLAGAIVGMVAGLLFDRVQYAARS